MTTNCFPTQNYGGFPFSDVESPQTIASDMLNFYPMPDNWVSTSNDTQCHPSASDYVRFPVSPRTALLEGQLATTNPFTNVNPPDLSSAVFKSVTACGHDAATVFPHEPDTKLEESSPISCASATLDPQGLQMSADSFPSAGGHQPRELSSGSTSWQTHYDTQSSPRKQHRAGRKPKAENVDPDSTRATYLEKNRNAASKCRSKQKRQQEALVEQAREAERKNKCLKAEVAMLQYGMRELIDMVGQHNACSDTRLKQYVQREADRLAAGAFRTAPFANVPEKMSIGP